ncbi:hypothetical protein M218_26775 [Burkholderia pseudomallei MSHR338]|nr:hypothetical protein M218_26775 [Burkholderia pseudomallei MSHR338]
MLIVCTPPRRSPPDAMSRSGRSATSAAGDRKPARA